jgi:AraC-like DNA-binding protein
MAEKNKSMAFQSNRRMIIFSGMDFQDIVGFTVCGAHYRKQYRTLYYSRAYEGEGHGTFIFVEKGAACFDFGKGVIRIPRGRMLCYESGTLKRAYGDPADPPSYYLVEFDLINRLGGIVKPADAGIPLLFRPKRPGRMISLMKSLVKLWNAKKRHYLMKSSSLGLKLLETLARSAPAAETTRTYRGRPMEDVSIGPVLDYLRRHYKETPGLASLSKRAGLHPASFARLFRKITGLPPRQYVLRRKIEHAKESILSDNLPFAETAEDLGFCDYTNFFRTFRKFTGLTPSAFCRKYRAVT